MAKTSLPPGFRFHPTDVELVLYYLKRKIMGKPFHFEAISEVELYKFAPWDLPDKSCLRSRDLEWYFFCPRDKKYANGSRINRTTTDIGYWKTTGKDRTIAYNSETVGMKKTLIFHEGKPPRGTRTDWVMYEFRLEAMKLVNAEFPKDAFVLCKIFQKSGAGPKNGEQYGAPFVEEDWDDITDNEHAVALPWLPSQEPSADHRSLSDAIPRQSACFEVGEPSSVPYLSESGALSSIPVQSKLLEIGEPPSVIAHSEVGHLSSIPQISYADEVLLGQLDQSLNASHPHQENANCEMFASHIMHEDVDGILHEDLQELYGGLEDILFPDITGCDEALQQGMGLDDMMGRGDYSQHQLSDCDEALQQGMGLDDMMGCGDYSQHQLSEFAAGNFVEIDDLDFLSTNQPFEWTNRNETQYSLANNSATLGLNNIFMDGIDVTTRQNAPHDTANDDLLPTSEDPLWLNMFPWLKDRPS